MSYTKKVGREKELWGYLIHYTIYFYFKFGRLPLTIEEFYKWFSKEFPNKNLLVELSKDGTLQKILRIWFYKIHKKGFLKLINKLKEIFRTIEKTYNIKTKKELLKKCSLEVEKEFQVALPSYNKSTKQIIFKVKFLRPDILIVCKEPIKVLIVIELKSGNRKLWKKYRKQLKEYMYYLTKYVGQFKGYTPLGILYYYKKDVLEIYTLEVIKTSKNNNKKEKVKIRKL